MKGFVLRDSRNEIPKMTRLSEGVEKLLNIMCLGVSGPTGLCAGTGRQL